MGELSHQLFEVNGDSGHTYRLQRRGNQAGFDMDTLDNIRYYASWRGHIAVAGGLETRTEGDVGWIKVKPELSQGEIEEIRDAGFSAEPLMH